MTQPHPQPKHCDHECVCQAYFWQVDDEDPCLRIQCEHDTRTHTPAAPATEPWCYPGCMLVYKAKEQGRKDGAKAEREQAAKRVDAFADSLHDLESIVIKGGLRELAESLRGGAP